MEKEVKKEKKRKGMKIGSNGNSESERKKK
jgi:hypothetical protein